MAGGGPRHSRDFRRRPPARAQYDVALIVCEGEKTEPEYLKGLRNALGLNAANISVARANGNDPVSIVRHAIQAYADAPGEFDRVFCVFDRDGHANIEGKLQQKTIRQELLAVRWSLV